MPHYLLFHTDEHGNLHQLSGFYTAYSGADAIEQMLNQSGSEDDGRWAAHEVADESQIIK